MAKNPKMVMCRNCNTAIVANVKKCPACGAKNKKSFLRKWWFVLLLFIIVIGGLASNEGKDKSKIDKKEAINNGTEEKKQTEILENDADKIKVDNADEGDTTETKVDEAESVDGMRREFKEAMDSYEAFYIEYCEMLKKYSSNPTDLTLLTEYTSLMQQSAEMSEKFEAWDENEMNAAELQYYLEINGRVTQMLLEAAQ